MDEEKLKSFLKWIPLAIAAGYFIFLVATWNQYLKTQAQNKEYFENAVEKWIRERNVKSDEP